MIIIYLKLVSLKEMLSLQEGSIILADSVNNKAFWRLFYLNILSYCLDLFDIFNEFPHFLK